MVANHIARESLSFNIAGYWTHLVSVGAGGLEELLLLLPVSYQDMPMFGFVV